MKSYTKLCFITSYTTLHKPQDIYKSNKFQKSWVKKSNYKLCPYLQKLSKENQNRVNSIYLQNRWKLNRVQCFLFTNKLKFHFQMFLPCMFHLLYQQAKVYKAQLHLVFRFRAIFILTDLEITKFISLLVRCNHTKPITKIILLKVFLGKVFQIPLK